MTWKNVAETGLDIAGGLLGGVVGNSIETGVNGYEAYEDFRSGNDVGGAFHAVEAGIHGAEAVADGFAGAWW